MLFETFVRSLRLKLKFEKRANVENVFLGLTLIVCILPIRANVFSTSKLINYVVYDDQQYAENKYLEMGPMSSYKKIVYKSVPVNDSSVCNMTDTDMVQVCEEIALYRRSRNSVQNRYVILLSSKVDKCKEYRLKLNWDYRVEKKIETVIVRKCPTQPSLYISDGKNIGGLFVYAAKVKGRKDLKLIDYITFVERTTPIIVQETTTTTTTTTTS